MSTITALADLEQEIAAPGAGPDRLRLVGTPFVPEVRLHLAEDAILWWARMEAAAGRSLPPPYWASVWAGGQALARHLLDHPDLVAGRRVLDLAAGSGLVAIAAALAGADRVVANDVDPYAVAAVTVNARANQVRVTADGEDLLDGVAGVDLVVAGDALYDAGLAARVLPYLRRCASAASRCWSATRTAGTCRRTAWTWWPAIRCRPPNPRSTPRYAGCRCSAPADPEGPPGPASGSGGGSRPMCRAVGDA